LFGRCGGLGYDFAGGLVVDVTGCDLPVTGFGRTGGAVCTGFGGVLLVVVHGAPPRSSRPDPAVVQP
jgi:hypothetical protein